MCNLYRMTKGRDEVARLFRAVNDLGGANFGEEVFPGYPGAVVAEGTLSQRTMGFPLVLKGKNGQPLKPKPVNNTRTDKLDSFFWRYSFEERRCLIPVTAWAEAEGQRGAMTRTWMSLPDVEAFAVAGIWRASDEWGDCYSMVMTDAAGPAAQVHNRMPVILQPDTYATWQTGSAEEALDLCRAYEGPLDVDRTSEPWARKR